MKHVDGWNWDATYKRKRLMSFFAHPSTGGMVLGFAGERLGDVHLTVYSKEDRIHTHVTDSKKPLHPWHLNFDQKLLAVKAARAYKRWLRKYASPQQAWIMTPLLRRQIASKFPRIEDRIQMPLEMMAAGLVFDRNNPRRWRKIKIRDLLTTPGGPGRAVLDGKLHWVQPLDSRKMLAFTDNQFERHWTMIFKELGLEKYFEYVAAEYPEFIQRVREKLEKLS